MVMTYQEFLKYVSKCSQVIDLNRFDYIVVPARGGLVFAGYLAYLQDSKTPIITINDNKLPKDISGNILLLDDINDTSATFFEIQSSKQENQNLTFMPMIERFSSKFKSKCPNIIQTSDYVIFPWDKQE